MSHLVIRPSSPDDAPAIVEVENAACHRPVRTLGELRSEDEHRSPRCKFQRYVAECDGRVVGFGFYHQWGTMEPPRRFYGNLCVRPDHQGRGIGSALYNHLMDALKPFDPLVLATWIREDLTRGIRFLQDRGFREFMRDVESQLDVASFDYTPYVGLEDKLRAEGIEIKTLKELKTDPDHDRKLYDLIRTIEDALPHSEPFPPQPFEEFREHLHKEQRPDGYFVAVHRGEYIGKTSFYPNEGRNFLFTRLTAVKPAFRRRGIATALKARGILYAKSHGYATIRTENRADNVPMLSLNERLGFRMEPTNIGFKKRLKEENA